MLLHMIQTGVVHLCAILYGLQLFVSVAVRTYKNLSFK